MHPGVVLLSRRRRKAILAGQRTRLPVLRLSVAARLQSELAPILISASALHSSLKL